MEAKQDGHMVKLGGRRLCVADKRTDAKEITLRYNAHEKREAALKAVLLFHSGVPWDYKAKIEWSKLVGPDNEATTKGMCDNIRAALAEAEPTKETDEKQSS